MELVRRAIDIIHKEGFRVLIRRTISKILRTPPVAYLTVLICIYRLRRENRTIDSVEKALDFAYNFRCLAVNIAPLQIREEAQELLKILERKRPEVVLEIGTYMGGTLFLWTKIASDDALIMSVDLPQGLFGGGFPSWKIPLYKAFACGRQEMYLIRADSHDPVTLGKVEGVLRSRKVDFLFIDGDHTYEGVKKDFEIYSKCVRSGGVIAFHDIVPGPPEIVGGVPKFWREVRDKYRYSEIVSDWNQGGWGIGVIYV